MRKMKMLLNNERGSTLIEVIVSVLIVGIAFVPLMVGLNASLTSNKMNENKQFAETVAENVLEVCKTYGANGLEKLAATGGISSVFSDWTLTDTTSDSALKTFTISGIDEGTKENYTAKIIFDRSAYDDYQNDYSNYQSIGNIGYAANVIFVDDALKLIVNEFYNNCKSAYPSLKFEDFYDSCNTWLKRELIIKIEEDTEDDSKYAISKQIKYSAVSNSADTSIITINGVNVEKNLFGTHTTTLTPVGSYKPLQNMIVIYSPMQKYVGGKSQAVKTVAEDTLVVAKSKDGIVNIYCLMNKNGEDLLGWDLKASVTSETAVDGNYPVKIYANTNLLPGGYFEKLDTFGSGEDSSKNNMMKDVTVDVFDNLNSTEPVITKKSTVIEFE